MYLFILGTVFREPLDCRFGGLITDEKARADVPVKARTLL